MTSIDWNIATLKLRLSFNGSVPRTWSLGAIAAALGDPLFIHRAFGIPANAVVTRSNIQSLTGMTPDQFLTTLRSFLTGLGRPFNPVDFSPGTGYLRQDLAGGFQDVIRAEDPFQTPHNRTFLVGVQRALFPDLAMSLTYVHRDIRDILGVRLTTSPSSRGPWALRSPPTADLLQTPAGNREEPVHGALDLQPQPGVEKRFRPGREIQLGLRLQF